jgi:hypothetical protein
MASGGKNSSEFTISVNPDKSVVIANDKPLCLARGDEIEWYTQDAFEQRLIAIALARFQGGKL